MPGPDPALYLVVTPEVSDAMLGRWLCDESVQFDEAVDRSLALRASCEVRMRRILLQQGAPGQSTYSWHAEVKLFAREDAWVPLAALATQSKTHVVSLLQRAATDGFRTLKRNLHSNELHYKHFAYNALLNVSLEKGLGLVLLVAAVEKRERRIDGAQLSTINSRAEGLSDTVRAALFQGGSYRHGNAMQALRDLEAASRQHRLKSQT